MRIQGVACSPRVPGRHNSPLWNSISTLVPRERFGFLRFSLPLFLFLDVYSPQRLCRKLRFPWITGREKERVWTCSIDNALSLVVDFFATSLPASSQWSVESNGWLQIKGATTASRLSVARKTIFIYVPLKQERSSARVLFFFSLSFFLPHAFFWRTPRGSPRNSLPTRYR